MRAIVFDQPGGPEVLRVANVPDPIPGPEDLLIRNFAAGVNRADLLQRRGRYPPPPGESEIMGLEFAGEVLQAGPKTAGFKTGDRVCGLLAGGGYAEKLKVHHRLAVPIPDHFSFEAAASVPEAFFTAYENLFTEGGLGAGEAVLIHAGASGVGTAAIQLAKRAGARVIATAGSEEKAQRCRALGADHAINYRAEDFACRILELTGSAGVDVVLDFIGASIWDRNIEVLKPRGRLLVVGLLGGAKASVDLSKLLFRRLRVIGTAMRGLPLEEKIAITDRFRERVLPDLAAGRLQPVIDRVFLMEEAPAAHERMENNLNTGKIILRL
ncbi:MAG: NAD(P)H-quinone oxidoreductase [Planctomycetes bacterium]|nr:NAD(P)H-quinone oxidoreductase [Planctomycetota bacterium]